MGASDAEASTKRTGLQSGAYSDDTSVYSLSSEDCSNDDFQLLQSRKAKRRNSGPSLYSGKSSLKYARKSAVSTISFVPVHATSNLRRSSGSLSRFFWERWHRMK
ncbi:hypothetical protein HPB50_005196 [Hyalomma asiaticum]|uniref:Uncharacterized protein n=1 Tax=Hyalomma asiaticum TaxID=266040 RepID=A0ACB7S7R4_HYAAI|nr:hypothetical protein HPB50_005196 [Hyalomma asiaticum]